LDQTQIRLPDPGYVTNLCRNCPLPQPTSTTLLLRTFFSSTKSFTNPSSRHQRKPSRPAYCRNARHRRAWRVEGLVEYKAQASQATRLRSPLVTVRADSCPAPPDSDARALDCDARTRTDDSAANRTFTCHHDFAAFAETLVIYASIPVGGDGRAFRFIRSVQKIQGTVAPMGRLQSLTILSTLTADLGDRNRVRCAQFPSGTMADRRR